MLYSHRQRAALGLRRAALGSILHIREYPLFKLSFSHEMNSLDRNIIPTPEGRNEGRTGSHMGAFIYVQRLYKYCNVRRGTLVDAWYFFAVEILRCIQDSAFPWPMHHLGDTCALYEGRKGATMKRWERKAVPSRWIYEKAPGLGPVYFFVGVAASVRLCRH